MHRYIPHTPADRAAMLARCGMQSEAELYADVPRELLLGRHYAIGERDERERGPRLLPLARRSQPARSRMLCRQRILPPWLPQP